MAVDGADPHVLEGTLEAEAHFQMEEGGVCKVLGGFWRHLTYDWDPGCCNWSDESNDSLNQPEKIGPGISVAFVATLYRVGFANIWGIPVGKKLKRKLILQNYAYEMVIVGINGILSGLNPKLIEENSRST